jgi:hypothetical protein
VRPCAPAQHRCTDSAAQIALASRLAPGQASASPLSAPRPCVPASFASCHPSPKSRRSKVPDRDSPSVSSGVSGGGAAQASASPLRRRICRNQHLVGKTSDRGDASIRAGPRVRRLRRKIRSGRFTVDAGWTPTPFSRSQHHAGPETSILAAGLPLRGLAAFLQTLVPTNRPVAPR